MRLCFHPRQMQMNGTECKIRYLQMSLFRPHRPDPTVEIAFIRRRSSSGSSSGPHSPISLQPPCSTAPQLRPAGLGGATLPGGLVPKIANSLNSGSETLPSVELTKVRHETVDRDSLLQ